jgi:hypothetical protein
MPTNFSEDARQRRAVRTPGDNPLLGIGDMVTEVIGADGPMRSVAGAQLDSVRAGPDGSRQVRSDQTKIWYDALTGMRVDKELPYCSIIACDRLWQREAEQIEQEVRESGTGKGGGC